MDIVKSVTLTKQQWQIVLSELKYAIRNYDYKEHVDELKDIVKEIEKVPYKEN